MSYIQHTAEKENKQTNKQTVHKHTEKREKVNHKMCK
jgi:hypothetical protein